MAIFIHVEVSARELDSKLLLAVLAAERGHTVFLGDVIGGVEMPFFEPGLFHTKSVSPSPKVLSRHKRIRRMGHAITSIDEEAALTGADYGHFSRRRFSEESIGGVSAVFTWGDSDYQSLKSHYPGYAEKFHRTGSPRADLWRPTFRPYWHRLESFPAKPFLLISSNLAIPIGSIEDKLRYLERSGSFNLLPYRRAEIPVFWARTFAMLNSFVEAIRFLSGVAESYDIVLRPHPGDSSTETWKLLLEDLPNVHVIRERSINHWVNGAFAVLHSGCTTALETVVAERPLITFLPFREGRTPESADFRLANDLGVPVRSLAELQLAVERFLHDHIEGRRYEVPPGDTEKISPKLVNPSPDLSAEAIVDVWGQLIHPHAPSKFRVGIFRLALLSKRIRRTLTRLIPATQSAAVVRHEDEKFPQIDIEDLRGKVKVLQEILGLSAVVRCRSVGEKTVLMEPVNK